MRDNRKSLVKAIAAERIETLFGLAENAKNEKLSHKYVSSLRKISSHYKVTIPKGMRDRICTHCNVVLVPGKNAIVRIASSKGYVVYRCGNCGRENHIFIKRKRAPAKKPKA